MSTIMEKLEGVEVEWKPLGEVSKVLRGKRLTRDQLSNNNKSPVYHGGLEPLGYYEQSNRPANSVMVINVGASAGTVGYSEVEFWSSDDCFCIQHTELLNNKFLYYYLVGCQPLLRSKVRVAGIPTLDSTVVDKLIIPIPPLKIQAEIVRILDNFTELTAELTARKKQYNYYRDQLLTPSNSPLTGGEPNLPPAKGGMRGEVEWKTLGKIGELIRGNGLPKIDFTDTGVPAIHYGQIYTYYGTFTNETKSFVSHETAKKLKKVDTGDVVITNTSENLEDVGKALVYLGKEQAVTGGHATIFKPNKQVLGKYFAYFTQTEMFAVQKRKYAKGTKVIDVSATDMAKIKIPIPSFAERKRPTPPHPPSQNLC